MATTTRPADGTTVRGTATTTRPAAPAYAPDYAAAYGTDGITYRVRGITSRPTS